MRTMDRSYSRCLPSCNNMNIDYTDSLPDDCLALIFSFLTAKNDRNNSSLVSHRWLRVEAQTRTHLSLYAHSGLKSFIPSIFTRFNLLTRLVLSSKGNTSINDNDIILVTSMCPNLTTLKLRECKQLTDSGMAVFSKNCKKLKKFSCGGCTFSYIGISALLENSIQIEVLSVEMLGYYVAEENWINVIRLGLRYLKILKLIHYGRYLDRLFEMIRYDYDNYLVEPLIHDVDGVTFGVSLLSKRRDLIVLISIVAENCKGLKKLYVEYWNRSQIGDEGLINAVGKHSVNLEELLSSSDVIAGCYGFPISLEIYWCACEPMNEAEMICNDETCVAFRILRIEHEPQTTSSRSISNGGPTSMFNEGS